jgi:hypothetical protein
MSNRNPPQGTYGPQSGIPAEASTPSLRFNPFRIFGKQRNAIEKLGTKGHERLTWERKELPGAGAGQYAWETYGLPPYPWGQGNIYVTNPLRETFPAAYSFQAVATVGIPPKGILQGQFTTQPLIDPNQAQSIGIIAPGSLAQGPNAIVNGAPILSP